MNQQVCEPFSGHVERADSIEPIQGRLQTLMATVDDRDTLELLEDTIFQSVAQIFNQMKRCGSIVS